MPKGPNGQKRPADVIGAAIHVAKLATGEIDETPSRPRGVAGGEARAGKLSQGERSKIAKLAAKSRWQREGQVDMQTATRETGARGREAACMYPNNSLREPVREYQNVVAELVKNTFTK